jgi:hypothetical protein
MTRSSSEEKLIKIINKCEYQESSTKKLREQIKEKDRKMSQDFMNINYTIKPKIKYYDENYIISAVKLFRDEKKAFIYAKGRYISGSNLRGKCNIWDL